MMRPGGFNGPMNGGGKTREYLYLDAGLQCNSMFQEWCEEEAEEVHREVRSETTNQWNL